MPKKIKIVIDARGSGLKIDKALLECGLQMSRKRFRRLLDSGAVTLNQKPVQFASKLAKEGDVVEIIDQSEFLTAHKTKLSLTKKDILYLDEDLVVINKPPLLASVPVYSTKVPDAGQLLSELLESLKQNVSELIPCHRLDKETSGVLVFARNKESATFIMEQFKKRLAKKTYYALCYGKPKGNKWDVSCYLSTINKSSGMVQSVRSGGKPSLSKCELVEHKKGVSLVKVCPQTGRSHQIRVHLQMSGIPIIGDKKYKIKVTKKLSSHLEELSYTHHFLHAHSLMIQGLKGASHSFVAPFPKNYEKFMTYLGVQLH